ncbi:MAG: endonuclease/exonuclease/phosphatase family protein [Spirochaetaceae bacterium]|nr:endonuclease/exonuclease/phosphatase family protein [Spirochaetaceae bacterium]
MSGIFLKILKTAGIIIGILILAFVIFLIVLTLSEYKPDDIINAEVNSLSENSVYIEKNKELKIMSWNIGYCGLGKNEDFFMDGGKTSLPTSQKNVEKYKAGIKDGIKAENPDILILQEVDYKSKRSGKKNQVEYFKKQLNKNAAFTYNYKTLYCPIPVPPLGKIASGLATYTDYKADSAERYKLPSIFKWPVRLANLKRCLLVTRFPVYENGKDTGKKLVLINFHLEAFDSGEAKKLQTIKLAEVLNEEYANGNYVIAGGDWNQKFPSDTGKYKSVFADGWMPGIIDESVVPEGWKFCTSENAPTCRSNQYPYTGERAEARDWQYWVIDGLLVSSGVEVKNIAVLDKNFEDSDHNPVVMQFELK